MRPGISCYDICHAHPPLGSQLPGLGHALSDHGQNSDAQNSCSYASSRFSRTTVKNAYTVSSQTIFSRRASHTKTDSQSYFDGIPEACSAASDFEITRPSEYPNVNP